MKGKDRLEQAFQLSEITRELSLMNIKENLGKKATKKTILGKLRERLVRG